MSDGSGFGLYPSLTFNDYQYLEDNSKANSQKQQISYPCRIPKQISTNISNKRMIELHLSNHKLGKAIQLLIPNQSGLLKKTKDKPLAIQEKSNTFDSNKISCLAQFALLDTYEYPGIVAESILYFKETVEKLSTTSNSSEYGKTLRKAEEILFAIERNCPSERSEEVQDLRNQYLTAFNNMPEGPGTLTQLDVDNIKRFSHVPENVICTNQYGQKYKQPSISADTLMSYFFNLDYTNVMHSRAVNGFEGKLDICDVILIGKEDSIINYISSHITDNLPTFLKRQFPTPWENEFEKISGFFWNNELLYKLGYANMSIIPIEKLEDQEKAKNFKNQGLQICVILFYPEDTRSSNGSS